MANVKALQELARAVGCTIKVERQLDGTRDYVLYDHNKDPLATETDSHDMIDSITAYKGSHPDFADAMAEYNLQTKGE